MSIKDALAGGSKSFSFKDAVPGTFVEGVVLSSAVVQATDIKTRQPKFYDDGNPMTNFVFELQTNLRDNSVENDNGVRSVWLKNAGSDKKAVRDAVQAAGTDDIYDGGFMRVTYIGDEETGPGLDDKKLKKVDYQKPQGAVGQAAEVPAQQGFQQQGQPQQSAPQGQGFQQQNAPQQPQGQQWGQDPNQGQPQQQGAPQGQPQQGQSPWGNQAPQNVPAQGQQAPQQPQQQGNPWGNSDQGQPQPQGQDQNGLTF